MNHKSKVGSEWDIGCETSIYMTLHHIASYITAYITISGNITVHITITDHITVHVAMNGHITVHVAMGGHITVHVAITNPQMASHRWFCIWNKLCKHISSTFFRKPVHAQMVFSEMFNWWGYVSIKNVSTRFQPNPFSFLCLFTKCLRNK